MKNLLLIAFFLSLQALVLGQDNSTNTTGKKVKILVHITHGPENPTRAALGFLVAKTAIEEGHTVNLFLAGDPVNLLRDSVLNTVTGVGTGVLRSHYDAIVKGNGKFYLSEMQYLRRLRNRYLLSDLI